MTGENQLEIVELVTSEPNSLRSGTDTRPIGRVRFDELASRPADLASMPDGGEGRLLELRLDFELTPVPKRSRYVAAFVCLRFHDPRIEAIELWMRPADPSDAAGVSVLRPGAFGWSLGDPEGLSSVSLSCRAFAVVRVPGGVDDLVGTVRFDASVVRTGWTGVRREHLRARRTPEFTVRVPQQWLSSTNSTSEPETVAKEARTATPAVRLCVAADTEQYSRFRVPEAVRAQQRFVTALADARRYAGLADAEIDLQESGDGQFAILPPGVDESVVIPKLVEGFRLALADVNSDLSDRARLRLRIALHRGHVRPGVNGWVGGAATAVHRLLDSDVLRQALAGAPHADFALIVSDVLYHDVIADHYDLLDPGEFVEVIAKLEAKNFTERAWVHVPGSP